MRRIFTGCFDHHIIFIVILGLSGLYFGSSRVWAGEFLPTDQPVPGGIAHVRLPIIDTQTDVKVVRAYFNERRLLVTPTSQGIVALVGIPLSIKPGEYQVEVRAPIKSRASFHIRDKQYPEQRLQVEKKMVNPDAQALERIRKESRHLRGVRRQWRSSDDPSPYAMRMPLEGIISSEFGLRRFFNDQPRNPHSGLDIAAAAGTPVKAAASGTIVDAGEYYFSGHTIYVDHGDGVLTQYCHLQEILVDPGQNVKQGEIIGKVGSSGRVTGPHLHWGLVLNGTMVDPRLWVDHKQ